MRNPSRQIRPHTGPAMTVRAADVTSLVSSIESRCEKGGFFFLENISSASVSSCASNDPLRLGQRPGLSNAAASPRLATVVRVASARPTASALRGPKNLETHQVGLEAL